MEPTKEEIEQPTRKEVEEFLAKRTPTPSNPLCDCSGGSMCVHCEATDLVRRLAAAQSRAPGEGGAPWGWNTNSNARHPVKMRDYIDKLKGDIGSTIEARIKVGNCDDYYALGSTVVELQSVKSLIDFAMAMLTASPAPSGDGKIGAVALADAIFCEGYGPGHTCEDGCKCEVHFEAVVRLDLSRGSRPSGDGWREIIERELDRQFNSRLRGPEGGVLVFRKELSAIAKQIADALPPSPAHNAGGAVR